MKVDGFGTYYSEFLAGRSQLSHRSSGRNCLRRVFVVVLVVAIPTLFRWLDKFGIELSPGFAALVGQHEPQPWHLFATEARQLGGNLGRLLRLACTGLGVEGGIQLTPDSKAPCQSYGSCIDRSERSRTLILYCTGTVPGGKV